MGCQNPVKRLKKLPQRVTVAHRKNPTLGLSQAIGGYSLGCLKGGKTFSGKENGVVLSQTRRGRFWAHSQMIDLLTELGEFTFQTYKKNILIGDLSLSRGGPTFGGHNSHQNGLDVDIWFKVLEGKPSFEWLQTEEMKSVLTRKGFTEDFGKVQVSLLNFLSQDQRVSRIFVNAKIKKYLCEEQKDIFDSEGLRKIRPWYGHDDHLHLRLKCPNKDKACQNQKEPPEGDGCDQLSWWFSDEAKKEKAKFDYSFEATRSLYIDKTKNLPKACKELVHFSI